MISDFALGFILNLITRFLCLSGMSTLQWTRSRLFSRIMAPISNRRPTQTPVPRCSLLSLTHAFYLYFRLMVFVRVRLRVYRFLPDFPRNRRRRGPAPRGANSQVPRVPCDAGGDPRGARAAAALAERAALPVSPRVNIRRGARAPQHRSHLIPHSGFSSCQLFEFFGARAPLKSLCSQSLIGVIVLLLVRTLHSHSIFISLQLYMYRSSF